MGIIKIVTSTFSCKNTVFWDMSPCSLVATKFGSVRLRVALVTS